MEGGKDMSFNPLERGDMRIQTPTRPRVVRGLPPVPPTAPEVEKKGPSKKAVAARIGGATVIGGSAIGAVQHHIEYDEPFTPAGIVRDIQSIPGFWWDLGGSALEDIQQMASNLRKEPVVVPSTFDPKATKGVIGENNSVQMTPDEFKKIAPPEVEGNNINLPFFLKLPEGAENAVIEYEVGSSTTGAKRKVTTETGEVKEVEVNGRIIFRNLPIGTKLVSAWHGKIYRSSASNLLPDGSLDQGTFFIQARDGKGNIFRIIIATTRIILALDVPSSNKAMAELKDDDLIDIEPGNIVGTIVSTANSQYFPGQISLTATHNGILNILPVVTPDGKAIILK